MVRNIQKHFQRLGIAVIVLSLVTLSLSGAYGQTKQKGQTPQKPSTDPDVQLESRLVVLDVNVTDHNNAPVSNLKKEQFQIFEDKVSQEIRDVSLEEVPVSVGIVVDTSGSMRRKLPQVIEGAINLVKQSRPQDEYFVVEFKDPQSIELVEDYTTNLNDIIDALKDMIASGGTALFDALSVWPSTHTRAERIVERRWLLLPMVLKKTASTRRTKLWKNFAKLTFNCIWSVLPPISMAKVICSTDRKRIRPKNS